MIWEMRTSRNTGGWSIDTMVWRGAGKSGPGRIGKDTVHRSRLLITAASGIIVLLGAVLVARVAFRVPRLYSDAATDHRREVVNHEPREWLTDGAALEALAEHRGIQSSAVKVLSGEGYRLEKGRICQLDGQPFLHLVYTEGAREISAYLRPRKEPGFGPLSTGDVGPEHIAVINGVHATGVFVADRAADVLALARSVAGAL
jgi:hypothetical protein